MEEVFPKVVFYIFGIPVRDTVISTWASMVIILAVVWLVREKVPTALEMVIEFVRSTLSDVMQDVDVDPFVPFLGSLGLFLLFVNNIGLVPLIETPTKDINTPLALALIVFFAVHGYGIQQNGLLGYLKSLATPMIILDVIGQASRTMSLSLRLFGNIIAGEIIVAVISRLVPVIAPLPMIALSVFSGVLQAYIFMVLATGYLAAVARHDESED
ncbi:MAG: F0F1 ATP synthase subunit A [Anaerolineae bacterium]